MSSCKLSYCPCYVLKTSICISSVFDLRLRLQTIPQAFGYVMLSPERILDQTPSNCTASCMQSYLLCYFILAKILCIAHCFLINHLCCCAQLLSAAKDNMQFSAVLELMCYFQGRCEPTSVARVSSEQCPWAEGSPIPLSDPTGKSLPPSLHCMCLKSSWVQSFRHAEHCDQDIERWSRMSNQVCQTLPRLNSWCVCCKTPWHS